MSVKWKHISHDVIKWHTYVLTFSVKIDLDGNAFVIWNIYKMYLYVLSFWCTANIKLNTMLHWENRNNPDSKIHGANMGPTWILSAQDGPHVGPMNRATRELQSKALFSNDIRRKHHVIFQYHMKGILMVSFIRIIPCDEATINNINPVVTEGCNYADPDGVVQD